MGSAGSRDVEGDGQGGHGLNSSDLSYALHALKIPRFKRISGLSRAEARVEDLRSDSFALINARPDLTLVNGFLVGHHVD